MYKQILLWILSGLLLCVVIVGGIWTSINLDKIKQGMGGSNIYTNEDLENAFNDGYNKAFTDKNDYLKEIAEYRDTIMILQDTISHLNLQITSLQTQVLELITDNTDKAESIELLNANVIALQTQVSNLNTTLGNLQYEVNNLSASNSTQASEIELLKAIVDSYTSTISGYENTITQLNALIEYLETTIPNISMREDFVVNFFVNGGIWDIRIVSDGSYSELPIEPSGNWIFKGWSIDGENVVDLASIQITTDIDFYAVIECEVTFIVDGEVYDTKTVYQSNIVTITKPVLGNLFFDGWSADGENIINLATFNVTESLTLIAKFSNFIIHNVLLREGDNLLAGTVNHMVEDTNYIFILTSAQFYRYDKSDGSCVMGGTNAGANSRNLWQDTDNVYYASSGLLRIVNKLTLAIEEVNTGAGAYYSTVAVYENSIFVFGYTSGIGTMTRVYNKSTRQFVKEITGFDFISASAMHQENENLYIVSSNSVRVFNMNTHTVSTIVQGEILQGGWQSNSAVIDGNFVYINVFDNEYGGSYCDIYDLSTGAFVNRINSLSVLYKHGDYLYLDYGSGKVRRYNVVTDTYSATVQTLISSYKIGALLVSDDCLFVDGNGVARHYLANFKSW